MTNKELKAEAKRFIASELWSHISEEMLIPLIEYHNKNCVMPGSSKKEIRQSQGAYNALLGLREDIINLTVLPDEEEKEHEA